MSINIPEGSEALFTEHFGAGGDIRHFFSPGRVNIIGEHLDYNGGFVFPAALSLGIHALVRFNDGCMVTMRSAGFPGEHGVDIRGDIASDAAKSWWNYPAGVIKYLRDSGTEIHGADILFAGTLPEGAGLSSSAAIEVLTAVVMTRGSMTSDDDRIRIALLCRDVENGFIGVQCGIMDQFAVAMGLKDHALLLKSDTLSYERVPFNLGNHRLVIMNTNKTRKLSDSKYNERRAECERALGEIRLKRSIEHLAEATTEEAESLTDAVIRKRARHVVTENLRVLASVDLLRKGDIASFGALLTGSHRSLRDDYEVTGFELDSLWEASLLAPGCAGARMTGAGFGGCAIAIVKNENIDAFTASVGESYKKATGLSADFYETEIVDGASEITGRDNRHEI